MAGIYAGGLSFPSFPSWDGNVNDLPVFVILVIIWVLEVPLIAVYDILVNIALSIISGADNTFTQMFGFMGTIFQDTQTQFAMLGIFAPVAAAAVWGAAALIFVYFFMWIVGMFIDQSEKDVETASEEA